MTHIARLRGKPARPTGERVDRVRGRIEDAIDTPAPGPRRLLTSARLWGLGVALITFIGGFAFYQVADPELTGDETHYVVFGRSLAEGWGIDLTRAYEPENYEPFYGGELDPHAQRFAGKDGRYTTWHGIGLPLLLAPVLKLKPAIWAARWVMLFIWALLGYHLFRLVLRVIGGRHGAAAIAVLVVALAPPLIVYSAQVFPEIPAAVLVVVALRALLSNAPPWVRLSGASAAATVLLWLNPRYATLTIVILVMAAIGAIVRRQGTSSVLRSLLPVSVPALVIGGSLIAFNLEVFGRLDPAFEVVSAQLSGYYFRPEYLYVWGIGGLIGTPSGLIPHAPVMLLALVAVPIAARALGTSRVLAVACLIVLYVSFNAFFGSPGYAPPGRYFVTVVPLLAVPLALVWAGSGTIVRVALIVLAALSVLATVTSAQNFQILYTNGTRHLQPIDVTKQLYPFALQEYRPSRVSRRAPKILHEVGVHEVAGGRPTLVARSPLDQPGALAYGPYETLQPGRYVARFSLWSDGSSDGMLGFVEIAEVGGDRLARVTVRPIRSGNSLMKVPFSTDGGFPLEMRVFFSGGVLGVQSVEAELLEPLRSVWGEVWKAILWFGVGAAIATQWARRWPTSPKSFERHGTPDRPSVGQSE